MDKLKDLTDKVIHPAADREAAQEAKLFGATATPVSEKVPPKPLTESLPKAMIPEEEIEEGKNGILDAAGKDVSRVGLGGATMTSGNVPEGTAGLSNQISVEEKR